MTTTAHRVQLMLPGQAAAPDGPVDPFMMYLMHHAFRRDLDSFSKAVAQTPLDDRATWQALEQRWIAFSEALHHHHSAEDAVLWPHLIDHTPPAQAAVLHAMSAEHSEIDPLLDACGTGFAQLAHGPDGAARERLTSVVAATRDCLSEHLAHEETGAMALVQDSLTHEQWLALEKQFSTGVKPTAIFVMVPWLLKGLDADDRKAALARVPFVMTVIATAMQPWFTRAERRAFRYGDA
ncbi:hemerythrin domain-containing protein [Gordonia sp. TBRC 11910]|uniref:Hemerythrin domain-containing protein n=1 Tax=Gordonia asplenii TaxID=2725283 RepID=A0A848KSY2_9ACTN|nr:hemerythrin domain-containing protein [Gordonia asplenii]NMO01550.1 hemerythrin domain-containing protein [Gordonia asplenii]